MSVFEKVDLRDLKLIDNLETGIAIINYDWVYGYVNKSFAKQMQINGENIIGQNLFDVGKEDRISYFFYNVCRHVMNERTPLEVEMRLLFKPDYWAHVRAIPIRQGILVKIKDSAINKNTPD